MHAETKDANAGSPTRASSSCVYEAFSSSGSVRDSLGGVTKVTSSVDEVCYLMRAKGVRQQGKSKGKGKAVYRSTRISEKNICLQCLGY